MRETRRPIAVAVAFLEIDARAVRQARLDAGDGVALAAARREQAVVGALVLERVIQVQRRAVVVQIVRADLAAGAEIAVRDLGVDLQALRYAVRAARADAAVLLARAVDLDGVLHEAVRAPAPLRVVADLHDGVGALALLLRQRHDER